MTTESVVCNELVLFLESFQGFIIFLIENLYLLEEPVRLRRKSSDYDEDADSNCICVILNQMMKMQIVITSV